MRTPQFVILIILMLAGCARAATEDARIPAASLKLVGGEPFDLAATIDSHDATVLVWWATECPCVRRYEARIQALNEKYADDAVAVLAVASNADDDSNRVRQTAADRGLLVPVVMDGGGVLATGFKVRTTPTTVVLDRDGRVRFHGWIDNEREPGERGRVTYVEDAVSEVLGGESAPDTSPTYGCRITRTMSTAATTLEVDTTEKDCGCKVW